MGVVVGQEIRTPGYVLAEMATVNAQLRQLIYDVGGSGADDTFRRALRAFAEEWKEFYDRHSSGVGAWWARGTTPVWRKTIEYRDRVEGWRQKFSEQGGRLSSPALPAAKRTIPGWLLLAGLGVGGYLAWRWLFADRKVLIVGKGKRA